MKKTLLPILLSATLWGYGEGIVYWAPHGCENTKHGGHGSKESSVFTAANLEGNGSAVLIKPDLSTEELPLSAHTLTLPKSGMGGYYALVLTQRSPLEVKSAIRYLSRQGRPSKISPTKLTGLSKTDLEIVPDPLHREHDRYTASKSYRFLVKFQGQPLSDARITMETQNRSATTYTSDKNGAVSVTLPNDFSHVSVGRSENKPSEFLLSTTLSEDGSVYQSTLTMPYYVNPNDYWQSQRLGGGVIVLGFLGGLLLYRRTKGAKRG